MANVKRSLAAESVGLCEVAREASQTVNAAPILLCSGLDSLYVSYYLDITNSRLDIGELAHQRQLLQQNRTDDFSTIQLGSETFALKPYGRHPYRYVLSNRDFEIRLAEYLQPSCHVQFFSESLWFQGVSAMEHRFHTWRQSLGLIEIRPDVVARADWAFDFHLPAIDFERAHFASRAAKYAIHGEHDGVQTFTFGKGDIVVRVYDKVAEIYQQSDKAWLFALWKRNTQVWRVEFQVRTPRLKEAGIRTLADLPDLQGDLLRELALHHTTLRRPSPDSNRSRWALHPLWRVLQEAILELPQTGLVRDVEPSRTTYWRLFATAKSLYGLLKAIGALNTIRRRHTKSPELEDVLATLPEILKDHHNAHLWKQDIERRVAGWRLGQW